MQKINIGATNAEWAHFSVNLELTEDVLPVVSNQKAKIDPASAMKALGKTPSRYNGAGNAVGFAQWTQYKATDADIAKWIKQPDYGICLQTRHVRALDIDVDDEALANQIRALILSNHNLPERYRENAYKSLFAFRLGGDFTKRKFKAASGIVEFLATGQQFIACGTHTSGERYQWRDGLPEEIPTLTGDEFESLWRILVETFAVANSATESRASVKQAKLADAFSADPLAAYLLEKNMVKRAERDGKLHITCPWESEHTTESDDSATTYWPAHTGGYVQGHFHCMHAHCDARTDGEFKAAIGYVDADRMADFEVLSNDVQTVAKEKPVDSMRFAPIHGSEFAQLVSTEWLIKGVLPKSELAIVFGESGSGKTFEVLDISMAIASGRDWRGHQVKQGAVVYVAAEGAGGFRKRLLAYGQHHDINLAGTPIYVIPSAPNLLEKKDALDISKAIMSLGPVSLVVIDTLAQTTAGGNENSGEDMGMALAHCKGIHRATGAMVLLVHHSGKDASKGARGWSGLRAACDVELEVNRNGSDRTLSLTKQKDGDDSKVFGFKLTSVCVGFDDDGEAITSCISEPTEATEKVDGRKKKKPALKDNEHLALRLIGEAMEGIRDGELISTMVPLMESGLPSRRREYAHAAIEALKRVGYVAADEEGFLIAIGGESA